MRPKGNAKELEMRRKIAARMLSQGKSVQEVAEAVGVTSTSVYRWKKALKQGGPGAVSAKPHPGRRPRLLPEQKKELEAMLLQGARAAGFPTELWTLPRVAQIIEAHFGVKYHPGHVWYLLRDMGWSAQKPQRRARERDEEAIQRWPQRALASDKKKPADMDGASSFSTKAALCSNLSYAAARRPRGRHPSSTVGTVMTDSRLSRRSR
jgi:transposase